MKKADQKDMLTVDTRAVMTADLLAGLLAVVTDGELAGCLELQKASTRE